MSELKQQWRALDHCEPPLRISPELLTRALAYRIQEAECFRDIALLVGCVRSRRFVVPDFPRRILACAEYMPPDRLLSAAMRGNRLAPVKDSGHPSCRKVAAILFRKLSQIGRLWV
jgi:hypothetical protein